MENAEKVRKLPKPTPTALFLMPRALASIFTGASVGRLSNLYPHWLTVKVEKVYGISSSRLIVLWILTNEGSVTMGGLSQAIDLTPRALTRIVDGLEENGYVSRRIEAKDKRITNVELTARGKALFKKIRPDLTEKFNSLFRVLDKKEMVELVRLIEKLTDHMKTQIDQG